MNNPLSEQIFKFLTALQKNNNREWFAKNKHKYESTRAEMLALQEQLVDEMSHYDELEKVRVFRIYRDVRFSKNKTPYKNNFALAAVRATKWRRGRYYLHLTPGGSFIGGGFWKPEKDDLKRIRTEIAADATPLRKILNAKSFKDTFGSLIGESLKTAPRGFEKDHPDIDLLNKKQFILRKHLTDQEVLAPDFVDNLHATFKKMLPFFDYMSEVLTTDENGVPIE